MLLSMKIYFASNFRSSVDDNPLMRLYDLRKLCINDKLAFHAMQELNGAGKMMHQSINRVNLLLCACWSVHWDASIVGIVFHNAVWTVPFSVIWLMIQLPLIAIMHPLYASIMNKLPFSHLHINKDTDTLFQRLYNTYFSALKAHSFHCVNI